MSEEKEKAQNKDDKANNILLYKNIFIRPQLSLILPKGTKKTDEANKKDIVTQLKPTADIENSAPIFGKATFTAAPINGLRKLEDIVTARKIFLFKFGFDSIIIFFLCESKSINLEISFTEYVFFFV